jgi:hypothetical protein
MDAQVKGTRRVGICGNQLVLSVIGACLQGKPGFEVQGIAGFLPALTGKPAGAPPDVVLFDLAANPPHFAISPIHAHPTITMIGIDLANKKCCCCAPGNLAS